METLPTTTTGIPRIGDKAPAFTATTTVGPINFAEFNLGSWVILFSHPADFTPVCTTELVEFARNTDFFDAHNTKLIGLSIDSIHSHLAWVQNVKEKVGVELNFPLIADIDTKVARLFGMLHPGESETATVRAVFFIDPNGTIRLIMYYPLNVGRNIEEVKRTLIALQTADENKCAMPVNWKEGDKVIVPAPKTLKDIADRQDNPEYEKTDFYLMKRDLAKAPQAA